MKQQIILYLKGMAMGAADIVPGVSGGTIAFITGIYERLVNAIASVPLAFLSLLKGNLKLAWQQADVNFLLVLLAGIATSILTLAKLVSWLLETQPILLWAFFFGLILVSCYLIFRQIKTLNIMSLVLLVIGFIFAAWLSLTGAIEWGHGNLALFFAGAIAICAMILPGISGSFLLVLMGMYGTVINAVHTLDFALLSVFALGCLMGLLAFSKVLRFTMQHYKDLTLSFLLGVMAGSLFKVWPWKETLTWRENRHGVLEPLQQKNILPVHYEQLFQVDAQLGLAILLALAGLLLVLGLEFLSKISSK